MSKRWKEEYSVKIKEIDEQHKKILGMINHVEELTKIENFTSELMITLNNISEYALIHFATEEKYMDLAAFELSDEHKKKHLNFKNDVLIKQEEFKSKKITALDVIWTYNFLVDWLLEHITIEDQKYVTSLKKYHDL